MTLESYKNFVTIVECGSILAAANKLLIAQPSLSNQLKNIEKNYGTTLIIRGSRSIELTDAGRIFYQKAKQICQLEENLKNELANEKTLFTNLLKISIPAGNSAYFMHKFFDSFIEKHPKVNYDLYEATRLWASMNTRRPIWHFPAVRMRIRRRPFTCPFRPPEIRPTTPRVTVSSRS